MGNCLVMEKKVIKIVRNDGKVLEYREPISVHNILSQFSNHSLSQNNNNNNTSHYNLLPYDAKLLSGHLYYLLPTTKTTTITKKTKKVTFATPEVEDDDTCKSNININDDDDAKKSVSHVVRMKIVVHKQELEKLLQGGSLHEIVYQSLEKQCSLSDYDNNDLECNKSWRPILDCIHESN